MKKSIVVIIIVIIIVIVGILGYMKYNQIYLPKDYEFTDADVHYDCYWGDINQKKAGTPNNWVLVYPGTRSAQWCEPVKADSMVRQLEDPQYTEYIKYKSYRSQGKQLPHYLACYVSCATDNFQDYKLCIVKNMCSNID